MAKFLKKLFVFTAVAGAVYGVLCYFKKRNEEADFDDFDDFDDDPEAELAEYLNDEAEQSEITEKAISAHNEGDAKTNVSREALKKAVMETVDNKDSSAGLVKKHEDVEIEEFQFNSLEGDASDYEE